MSTPSHPCVVAGVDSSLRGLAALRFAAGEAARRGVPLYAVRVQSEMLPPTDCRAIDDAFAEALGGFPSGVEVHKQVAVPLVAAALARRASSERDLLVVGESGHGVWHAFWFGSVARACLRKTVGPVVAVPAPEMARSVTRPRCPGVQALLALRDGTRQFDHGAQDASRDQAARRGIGDAVSGGERQRIALTRAPLSRAPVLVLDEPTAHLVLLDRRGGGAGR